MCRNLASLQRHRRAVYDELIFFRRAIIAALAFRPAVIRRSFAVCADGQNISLSPGNLPLVGLAGAMAQLQAAFASGCSLALCGIGDGYLFHQLAQNPPALFMDTQQCIFLMEPDAHVLLTALMIHDYTGSNGPIEQERFLWFVGSDWLHGLRRTLLDDPFLASPQMSLLLGLHLSTDPYRLAGDHSRHRIPRRPQSQGNRPYYGVKKPSDLSAFFREPPRQPRVMLLTTRFSPSCNTPRATPPPALSRPDGKRIC